MVTTDKPVWFSRTELLSSSEAEVLVGRVGEVLDELRKVAPATRLAILDHILENHLPAARQMKFRTMDALQREGHSYEEIGDVLGVTKQWVYESLRIWRTTRR